jgi:hypothetical protein
MSPRSVVTQRIPWARIVELARHIEQEYAARGAVDIEAALRLARAVLQFQEQLVGELVRIRP